MKDLSFRARLTLRWAVSFGLLLAAANAAIYFGSRAYAYRDLQANLRTLAVTELASAVDEYRGVHIHDFPVATLNRREYTDKFVQMLAPDGRVLAQSSALAGSAALVDRTELAEAIAGRAPIFRVVTQARPGLMTALATEKDGATYVVAVGLFTDRLQAGLQRLARLLGLVWFGGLMLTGVLGYLLASRALGPIDRITRRATAIARGDFAARLDPPLVDDEIGRMTRLLNEMLDRLHGALEANRTFASDASHELRSPLTAMRGEIEVALARERSPEEYRETLRLVHARVVELAELTHNLMLLVRAQEGRSSLMVAEVPLLPLLRDAVRRLAPLAEARGVTIRFEQFPGLIAYADARLLARVFDNVIHNAVQYNHEGGAVLVRGHAESTSADESGTSVVVDIRDTGIGIPRDDWERVFDRFYRSDRSRSRRTGGAGLGLSICREVVALFGGSVRVAESSPNGTTFEVSLPGERVGSEAASEAATEPPRLEASVGITVK